MTFLVHVAMLASAAPPPAAAAPTPATPQAVEDIRWAQPFTLAVPTRWTLTAAPRTIHQGWLVEVRAPAPLLQARAVGQPLLMVNDVPVRPLHAPLVATCTVVVVPGDVIHDLADGRWYLGSTELPERLDADRAAAEHAAAIQAGVPVTPPLDVLPPLAVENLADLARVAEERFERCRTSAGSDGEPAPAPTDEPPARPR